MREYKARILNDRWTEQQVVQALRSSPERHEVARAQHTISDAEAADMVRRAYQSVLNREPDANGMRDYKAARHERPLDRAAARERAAQQRRVPVQALGREAATTRRPGVPRPAPLGSPACGRTRGAGARGSRRSGPRPRPARRTTRAASGTPDATPARRRGPRTAGSRVSELASGGSVFPIPWNTLELTNDDAAGHEVPADDAQVLRAVGRPRPDRD